jgi:hypothetical protein
MWQWTHLPDNCHADVEGARIWTDITTKLDAVVYEADADLLRADV